MKEELNILNNIFSTTKVAIEDFMNMLTPVIQQAKDDHERLYYHHIFEEEEQRLSRLAELLPLIDKFQRNQGPFSPSNREFNQLLQELNLEKFGLHNFVEHLDLAMFHFTDEDRHSKLQKMREISYNDYSKVKQMLQEINSRFDHGYIDPHAHHDHEHDHLDNSQSTYLASETHDSTNPVHAANHSQFHAEPKHPLKYKKQLTVGSLK